MWLLEMDLIKTRDSQHVALRYGLNQDKGQSACGS
jgi:hypothetical protein